MQAGPPGPTRGPRLIREITPEWVLGINRIDRATDCVPPGKSHNICTVHVCTVHTTRKHRQGSSGGVQGVRTVVALKAWN